MSMAGAPRTPNGLTYQEACYFSDPRLIGTRVQYLGREYRVRSVSIVDSAAGEGVYFTLVRDDGSVVSGIHHSLVGLPLKTR